MLSQFKSIRKSVEEDLKIQDLSEEYNILVLFICFTLIILISSSCILGIYFEFENMTQ